MAKVQSRDAHPKVREAFRIFTAAKRLDSEHFTAGPFVGWLGEQIVEHEFPGMRRAPAGNAGFDFIDRAKRRVQVKAWGTDKRSHDKLRDLSRVDRFIRLRIYDDGYEVTADILTAPHGTYGGIVVYRSGNIAKPAWGTAR